MPEFASVAQPMRAPLPHAMGAMGGKANLHAARTFFGSALVYESVPDSVRGRRPFIGLFCSVLPEPRLFLHEYIMLSYCTSPVHII